MATQPIVALAAFLIVPCHSVAVSLSHQAEDRAPQLEDSRAGKALVRREQGSLLQSHKIWHTQTPVSLVRDGWCNPWKSGAKHHTVGLEPGVNFFGQNWWGSRSMTQDECFTQCNADDACEQAVFRSSNSSCWLGIDTLPNDPGDTGFAQDEADAGDTCYAKNGFGFRHNYAYQSGHCDPWSEGLGLVQDCLVNDPELRPNCSYFAPEFDLSEKGCFSECTARPDCTRAEYSVTKACWIGTETTGQAVNQTRRASAGCAPGVTSCETSFTCFIRTP